MDFKSYNPHLPIREVRHYRIIRVQGVLGFEIEAFDKLPDDPILWFERSDAILHHHGNYFIVLKNVPEDVKEELLEKSYAAFEEKHQRRLADALSPFGMVKQGTARIYEVQILKTLPQTAIRDKFKSAIEVSENIKNNSLSSIFSA